MGARITRTAAGAEPADRPEAAGPAEPRKPRKRVRRDSLTLTFDVPHDLNFVLSGVAQSQRMKKSAFILKLLRQGCGSFKIASSLERVWAETQGQDVSAGQS